MAAASTPDFAGNPHSNGLSEHIAYRVRLPVDLGFLGRTVLFCVIPYAILRM